MELGKKLKELRTSRGYSVAQLAEKAKVGNGTVGDIERGKSKSTVKTLNKLSKALDLTETERAELFSSFVPEDIAKKIDKFSKRELSQYDKTINEASIFFNNESNSDDDMQKLYSVITDLFLDAKMKNKEKYKKKK